MSNDFVYDMSEINEEDMFKGWEEMVAEDGSIWETGYEDTMMRAMDDNAVSMEEYDSLPDYIPGLDDGEWMEEDEGEDGYDDDFQGEEDFA
jgi:hypothetical protein